MEDRFIKYSKLYVLVFLLFLSVPVLLGLIFFLFYGFSKVISSGIADIVFGLLVTVLPAALFMSVYAIFFTRTKNHPSRPVKTFSQLIFIAAFVTSVLVLLFDIKIFFAKFSSDIDRYYSYSLLYLAGNVALLFIIAIIQAFTTQKEVDWMDRNR